MMTLLKVVSYLEYTAYFRNNYITRKNIDESPPFLFAQQACLIFFFWLYLFAYLSLPLLKILIYLVTRYEHLDIRTRTLPDSEHVISLVRTCYTKSGFGSSTFLLNRVTYWRICIIFLFSGMIIHYCLISLKWFCWKDKILESFN